MKSFYSRKRVLVTGASSGIGRALAEELALMGAQVVALARRLPELEGLKESIFNRSGVDIEIIQADLTNPAGFALAADALNKIDILINNAGFGMNGRFLDASRNRLDAMFQLNLVTPVLLSARAAALMKGRAGCGIMNVASIAGMVPTPFHGAYSATKAGLLNFTEGLHSELEGHQIHVSALCPGVTDTEFFESGNYETRSLVYRMPRLAPRAVARSGLKALAKGKMVMVPGLATRCLIGITRIFPRALLARLSGWTMNTD